MSECGVDHLEQTVEEGTAEGSSLPGDDIEFAIITFLETRAGGKYDRRRTGGDMTHGKGMNALENFGEVTRGLMGMYDVGTAEYEWLKIETPTWDRLAEKLYNVCCFMKSQEKRDPEECDDLLYELLWAWKGAFPDVSFNKFHGLFCGNRNFVHKYKAIGIFSEESCEAYMSVLEKGKDRLRLKGMPETENRDQSYFGSGSREFED